MLLYLYCAVSGLPGRRTTNEIDIISLSAGAAFSLWRAVFLGETSRGISNLLTALKDFLTKLVRDNAINYSDDKSCSSWTVGYYLTSAKLRLKMACEMLPSEKRSPEINHAAQTMAAAGGASPYDTQAEWEDAFKCLCLVLNSEPPSVSRKHVFRSFHERRKFCESNSY